MTWSNEMQRLETKIKIGEQEIIIREITINQSQQVLDSLDTDNDSYEPDLIDMLFPESIPAGVVYASTGLNEKELGAFTPSELSEIIKKVEDVNPTFADLVKRLGTIGREVLSNPELKSLISKKQKTA
jgi:hypothetical protein